MTRRRQRRIEVRAQSCLDIVAAQRCVEIVDAERMRHAAQGSGGPAFLQGNAPQWAATRGC